MAHLRNAAGEVIATSCKWSQPFLLLEWMEVDVVFDDHDELIQLSGPSCKYEVWYEVGSGVFTGQYRLCVDM
jgi:hypothetical protein